LRRAVAGVVVLLVGLTAVGLWLERRMAIRARLPQIPEPSIEQTSVLEHLRGKYAEARDDMTPAAIGALCLAYHADMFLDEAQRCYLLAEELAPADWRWTYYRSLIFAERGDSDGVRAGMRRVVDEDPSVGLAWWWLGDAEFKQGRYEQAEEALHRAAAAGEPERTPGEAPRHIASVPLSAYASLGLARIASVRGDAATAQQILERVTATAPRFGSAFRLLAESYDAVGRRNDSARMRRQADRLPPYAPYADPMVDRLARESRNSTFLLRQASDADLADSADWSEYLTRRALEFDPDNPDVVSKLGRILRNLQRNGEALQLFLRYNKMVPGDYQGIAQIGSCLLDLGRLEEAEPYVRHALAGLDDALTHYNLGLLLSRTGRLDEAATEYRRALERDPHYGDARGNLAVVLVRQGRLVDGSHELMRTLEIDPDNVMAHVNLGLVLAQQGQTNRAVEELEAALRLDPNQREAAEALQALRRQ
jgi:tetratricopeptide (TPR) repeat protein